ncbi:restriction endonuclease subunit S [Candidatus Pseudoruminococcus sp.]|uniref:restriction endonuclease subunit S n=1 Tax=Candidatus Pseudoruminococcus sp. TaxID=3101048 RepID=UPI00399ACCEC
MKKYAVLTREPRCFLGSFDFSWEQRKLEDYLTVSAEKNTGNIYGRSDVLSVSGDYGIVNQIEFQGRSFAGASVSNYGVVQTGDVVYTKSPLNSNPYGIIKTNKGKPGIVSTLYAVYHPKENAFSDFIQVYFEQHARMNNYMHPLVNKGAKNDMKVSAENALKGPVCFPSRIEQESISAFFSVLDNLITLHQRKCVFLFSFFRACISMNFTASTFSWEQRKLGELGTITTGNTPSTSIPDYYSDDGIVWVTPTDICENITFESARKLSDLGQQVGRVVPKNTILVTCIASIGKNTMLGNTGSFNQQINGLTPNENKYDPYFLLTESALWSAKMKGSAAAGTMQIVNRTEFSELKTWLPSLIEQQAIGAFFKQLDHLITLHQRECISFTGSAGRLILTANKKRTASSWEQRKLGDIADIVGGGTPSTGNQSYWDGDIDWYAPAEIADQIYANSSQKKITGLGYENSSAKMLPPGTVLFTSRAGIGKTAILTRKGCTNQGFQSIVPHRGELDSYFIFSRTEELKRYGELVGAGSTFVEVSGKQMAVMELMMPPTMREQQTIGGFFQQLDNLITLHQRKPFLMKWRTSDANRNQTNRLVL